jgi:hypothetical protein
MALTRTDLLHSIRHRQSRTGLTTADRYLQTVADCLQGNACSAELSRSLQSHDWKRALDDAESKFVYCQHASAVLDAGRPAAVPLPEGAVLDFEAVITTTRRDRDGDILESAGAEVDPDAVLLWQHIPFQPIGRLMEITEHSSERIKARLSIADTELGRDAATLASFGAVKISHGFEPRVFEPLPDSGWHIKRFEIFEISLVSIPSNRDAVITAFSRRQLKSPMIREWARRLWRQRPCRGAGIDPEPAAPPLETACRQFIARASCADAGEAKLLRQTHDVLGKVIDHLVRN